MNLWCESWKQTKAWMPITLEQKVVVMVEQSQCKWHVKPQWHLITRQLRLHHNHIAQLHEWNAIWHSVGVSPGYSLNIIGSSKYHNLQHSWYKIGGICIKKYTLWEIVFASDLVAGTIHVSSLIAVTISQPSKIFLNTHWDKLKAFVVLHLI